MRRRSHGGCGCGSYHETIRKSQNLIEESLLLLIAACLPPGCKPIFVMDRGYARASLLRQLRTLNIPFILRGRGTTIGANVNNGLAGVLENLDALPADTKARIVPLLNGGGLFETGAGGSAPKHVQQILAEGHLRWDSLGEYCALVPSLALVAGKTNNTRAALLGETLDQAIGTYLENARCPSRKVHEIDNRGSTFYLALYWAQALAVQDQDETLKARFTGVAHALAENEAVITAELLAAQGAEVNIGGYYHPDDMLVEKLMRPSPAFNAIIDAM